MGEMKRALRNGVLLAAGLMLAGCGWLDTVMPDRRPDYKTARTVEPLEVPPDLASSTLDDSLVVPEIAPAPTATLSDYRSERQPASAQPASGVLRRGRGMEPGARILAAGRLHPEHGRPPRRHHGDKLGGKPRRHPR